VADLDRARPAVLVRFSTDPLLEPTYNGLPIRANSSEPSVTHGVRPERASSFREALDGMTMAQIDGLAGDLYERAVERSLA
jgi:hypothetical protein